MRLRARYESLLWGARRRSRPAEAVRLGVVCGWKFINDRGPLRAAALAFSSSLGLVPLLAMVFAVLKIFGGEAQFVRAIIEMIAPGNLQAVERITEYVSRVKVSTIGIAGVGSFILSALFVLNNVEQCFNDIWGVEGGRRLLRKITDYTAILIFCPLLLFLSTSMVTTAQFSKYLHSIDMVEKALPLIFSLGPFVAKAVAFGGAYLIIPNHRVGFRAALLGGCAAALGWQAAESFYIRFGIGMVKTNAVYGALAQLPAFLLWIYLGWCIVIFGAELACVAELPGRGRYLKGGQGLWSPRLDLALSLLARVALANREGRPIEIEELIAEENIHPVEGRKVVGELAGSGLLAFTAGTPSYLVPGRNPDHTPFSLVLTKLSGQDKAAEESDVVHEALAADFAGAFGSTTWGAWAEKLDRKRG